MDTVLNTLVNKTLFYEGLTKHQQYRLAYALEIEHAPQTELVRFRIVGESGFRGNWHTGGEVAVSGNGKWCATNSEDFPEAMRLKLIPTEEFVVSKYGF